MVGERSARLAAALCVAALTAACTGDGSPTPGPSSPTVPPSPVPAQVKVAYLEDLSTEGAALRVAPAFQGAKLAFDTAALSGDLPVQVQLVGLDTEGDAATASEVARQMAEDPSYVAAIGAPYLGDQGALAGVLDPAGVPFVTLSGLDPGLAANGWMTWRRAVATQAQEAAALAGYVDSLRPARDGVCLARDGSRVGTTFLKAVASTLAAHVLVRQRVLPTEESAAAFTDAVTASGCDMVVWGGFSAGAVALERHLVGVGLAEVRFVGDGGIKDTTYLQVADRAGDGTVASCPCADLSTSTEFAAQRFIQDYQADFGLPPGSYAAEAWDVAHMFLDAFRSGATTRGDVLAFVEGMPPYEGLANSYVFSRGGDLEPQAANVYLYEDEGGRWLPLSPAD